MLISLKRYVYLAFIALTITACGGGAERAGFLDVPNLQLESLVIETVVQTDSGEVITPIQLNLSGDPVETFDPNATGPYTAEVQNEIVEIRLSAELPENTGGELFLVPFSENADGDVESPDEDLNSGEAVTLSLAEGENRFFVRVRDSGNGATVDYVIEINRLSTSARLDDLSFLVRSSLVNVGIHPSVDAFLASANDIGFITTEIVSENGVDTEVTRPAGFSPDEFEYFLAVRYNTCTIDVRLITEQQNASATFDGVPTRSFVLSTRELAFGSNAFNIQVTSEVGTNQTDYNFRIFRTNPSEDDIAQDPHLSSFSISEGEFTPLFECVVENSSEPTYSIVVQPEHDPISVVASTFNSNTVINISRPVLEENGDVQRTTLGDGTTVVVADTTTSQLVRANESFPHADIESDDDFFSLSDGSNLFLLETFLPVGEQTIFRQYLLNIFRSTTPFVEVSSAEELQTALQNAVPNQEIIIEDGTFIGDVGISQSGSDLAHFYSSQSGTAEQPIVLRGRNPGQVTLSGDGSISMASVLRIEGSFWDIRLLNIDNGHQGMTLMGANSNFVSSINFTNNEQSLVIGDGSSNNVIRNIVVSSAVDSADNLSAIQIGDLDAAGEVSGNQIWNSIIGENIAAQLLSIESNASNTEFAFNEINLDTTNPPSGSAIVNEGGDTVIRFNHFVSESVVSSGLDSVLGEFGVNTLFNDNLFSLNSTSLDIANIASGVELFESNNVRSDTNTILFSGDGTVTNFSSPSFQIESATNPGMCLSTGEATVDVNLFTAIGLSECLANDNQVWRFTNDGEGFVTIEQAGDSQFRLSPTRDIMLFNALSLFERTGDFLDEGFVFRWNVLRDVDNTVLFLNKDNLATRLRTIATPEIFSTPFESIVVSDSLVVSEDSRFNLLPVAQ